MLSKKQLEIVESEAQNIVVLSAAASGKTEVLTKRVEYLLKKPNISPDDIVVITFTNAAAEEMRERLNNPRGLFIGTIHAYANYLLLANGTQTAKYLESDRFDELFEILEMNPSYMKKVKYLFLDEAQDSNELQFNFILNLIMPESFFIIGDLKQCQPEGTKILLRGGQEKNIEDIIIGDDLVYYDNKQGRCSGIKANTWNAIHKRVTQVASRKLNNENIITIYTENGLKSSYTENHRTFIKINENTEYQHVVYLMSKNNRFRVGKVPLRGTKSKNGNPWREKMIAEGCDKVWILKAFKTDQEARVFEQKISYYYQIPQLCWQTNKVTWSKEDIDYIYEGIDTYKNAKKCLEDYNRNIFYPLIDRNLEWSENQKFASNATSQIFACNIMEEFMDCVVYGSSDNNHSNKHFEHIIKTEFYKSNETVYSLEVEGGTYIADGIVTHNCIYEWNGSRPDILKRIIKEENVKVYDLNENYRNGRNILNYAKTTLSNIKPKDNWCFDNSIPMYPAAGRVIEMENNLTKISNFIKEEGNYGDWFILTRTNAQLDKAFDFLTKQKIPCDTFRKSELDNKELNKRMKKDTVKILTIHTAKGLENKNVVVIGANFRTNEECRISYVAATRAKEILIWTTTKKKRQTYYNWE